MKTRPLPAPTYPFASFTIVEHWDDDLPQPYAAQRAAEDHHATRHEATRRAICLPGAAAIHDPARGVIAMTNGVRIKAVWVTAQAMFAPRIAARSTLSERT